MGKRPAPEVPPDYRGPVRSCLSCRRRLPQAALLRLTYHPSRGILPELTGRRRPGRGAYLCANPACHARARQKGLLARALRCPVPGAIWETLAPALALWGQSAGKLTDIPVLPGQVAYPVCREETT